METIARATGKAQAVKAQRQQANITRLNQNDGKVIYDQRLNITTILTEMGCSL